MNSSLPPEKIKQIKQIIHDRYNEVDIQSQIRTIIAEQMSSNDGLKPSHQEAIVHEIRKKGIIDSLMSGVKFENHIRQTTSTLPPAKKQTKPADQEFAVPLDKSTLDPHKRQLYVQLLNGKAFLEYMTTNDYEDESDDLPGTSTAAFFTIYIHFRGQRFRTAPFRCACEPRINEGFLLDLTRPSSEQQLLADSASLLATTDRVHLVMTRTEPATDTSQLVASHFLEWRTVLTYAASRQTLCVELMGTGAESKLPAGVLNVCLQLVPGLVEPMREDLLGAQLGLEHSKNTERERLFLVYAKQWWKEYLEIRADHKNRLVKIFAQDELGANRLVCSYVRAMRAGRLLDSPRHAARFVSLINFSRPQTPPLAASADHWLHLHTFLARNSGDHANHALLLCNLLLGFGLDAYVAVGTKGSRHEPHTWVVTLSYDYEQVVFWEPLTANRYVHVHLDPDAPPMDKQLVVKHPYRTVGCLFNERAFYANCQPLSFVDTCCFRLRDQSKWKAMSEDAILTVCDPGMVSTAPAVPALCRNPLDTALAANDLERQLRALITHHRSEIGLATSWDDHLGYVLSPALASYELERVSGLSVGNEEFDQAVKLSIPDGHSFKAFPIQFLHRNARKAFAACLKASVAEEIIACRGDQVKLALRVKVIAYPENTVATWLMIACRYKIIV